MPSEYIFGIISVLLSLIASIIYCRSVLRGETRPHFCTHSIWALTSLIVCFAQVSEEAGPGAWVTMINATFFVITTILSLRWGENNITRSDWLTMFGALIAIVPWYLTNNPMWSVILVTIIDVIAYYPTLRKSWTRPREENLTTYGMSVVEFGLSIPAMRVASFTNILYPVAIVAANMVLIGLCWYRKRQQDAVSLSRVNNISVKV